MMYVIWAWHPDYIYIMKVNAPLFLHARCRKPGYGFGVQIIEDNAVIMSDTGLLQVSSIFVFPSQEYLPENPSGALDVNKKLFIKDRGTPL